MKLTFTCVLKLNPKFHGVLDEISLHASKFYNMTLYELKEGNSLTQTEYYNLFRGHFRCNYLQMHTYCQAIKQAMKDMLSYGALLKKYIEHPENNQKPGIPKFKHGKRQLSPTFMKTAIRLRNGHLLLSIGKKMKSERQIKAIDIELPEKVYDLLSDKHIKMVIIKASGKRHEVKFVYEIKEEAPKETGDIMAIDLGVKNIAAITFLDNTNQYLVDGNVLKSRIAYFNKKVGIAYSKEMKITGNSKFKLTRKMRRLMKSRKDYIDYYIHKSSKMIIDLAMKHDVKTIVIGDFKHIKKENNQKYFVLIPHRRLIDQIIYKAQRFGLEAVLMNEAYTSSVSSIDLEPIEEAYADKRRRVVRGQFLTSIGLMNSDINGSLNILRKYLKDTTNNPRLIKRARAKGFRENPIRLQVV